MSGKDEVLKNSGGFLEILLGGAKRLLSGSGMRNRTTSFQWGFRWLLGHIVLSLAIARFIFWSHSWNFSWTPQGLASIFVLFFVVVHLGIGPSCILFCEAVREIGKIRRRDSCRPSRVFLRDFAKRFRYICLKASANMFTEIKSDKISTRDEILSSPILFRRKHSMQYVHRYVAEHFS